ncbi:MAG: hypothetical protein DRH17_06810 [Deltaproteobacteria bacterium]|nr:MAG: hypothetical protein DRH17_06810 [Deltaproteobacteria bacterium]
MKKIRGKNERTGKKTILVLEIHPGSSQVSSTGPPLMLLGLLAFYRAFLYMGETDRGQRKIGLAGVLSKGMST